MELHLSSERKVETLRAVSTLMVTVLLFGLVERGATHNSGIICHDCSGEEECDLLLKHEWTGKCNALITGKCFLRLDPNKLTYRGCADSLNWPHDLDMTYNGCRYQSYGEWSNTEVLWCFCDHSLCNVNISYLQLAYPSAGSSQGQVQGQYLGGQVKVSHGIGYWHRVDTTASSSNSGGSAGYGLQGLGQYGIQVQNQGSAAAGSQSQGQSQGQSQSASGWSVVDTSNAETILKRPVVVSPLVRLIGVRTSVSNGESQGGVAAAVGGGGSLPAADIVQQRPVSNFDANVDWAAVQKYLQEIKLSEGRLPSRGSSSIGISYSPQGGSGASAAGSGVVVIQSGQSVVAGGSSGGGGGIIRTATTPPPLNVAGSATVASPSSGSLPTSVAELFSLLNGILRDLGLTAVSPAANATSLQLGSQLIYVLPPDLTTYLQTNLPRDLNNVQSLPYPLYVILYLLSIAGYDINSMVPGQNITYSGLVNPASDIVPTLPTVSLADVCSSAGFTPVSRIGSCYKIVTPTLQKASDAKPVAQAQARCRELHKSANLASIESPPEKSILTALLQQEILQVGQMLDSWQGWWTGGSYQAGVNLFVWRDGSVIANTPANWGFQLTPFLDTCAWVLQIPFYNYTLGNYDCNTSSGYICEINTKSIATATP